MPRGIFVRSLQQEVRLMDKKSLEDLGFRRILEALARHAETEKGRDLALKVAPVADYDACVAVLAKVDEALELLRTHGTPPMGDAKDVSALIDRARRGGVLLAAELVKVAATFRVGHEVRKLLERGRVRAPSLYAQFSRMPDLSAVAQRIFDTFDEDMRIRDDASPRLGPLRREAKSLQTRVRERMQRFCQDPRLQSFLQDEYFTLREGRYVLPVKSEDKRFVRGIIHGTSQTGATVYVEPEEVVSENNRLKEVLDQIEVEEFVVLQDRSALVGRFADGALRLLDALWDFDQLLARAKFAREIGGVLPEVVREGDLHLLGARNPLLVVMGREVVPVEVRLGGGPGGIILSGPNAGGKSVTLATVGLTIAMLRAGLLPPVSPESRIPLYGEVITLIGDQTDLERAESTFTGQMNRVRQALECRVANTLVLLDELCSGTDPRKGEALARAIVEALADAGAIMMVASHFGELKRLPLEDARFQNARMASDPSTGRPSFEVEYGQAGESNPFEVAVQCGIPREVVDQARSTLDEREVKLEELIAETRTLKESLLKEKAKAEELRAKLEHQRSRYEQELRRVRKSADRLVHEARREALAKIRTLEGEIERMTREIRLERKRAELLKRRRQVRARKEAVLREIEQEAELVGEVPRDKVSTVQEGQEVFVVPVRAVGRVVDVSKRGDRVVVQVGAMRVKASLEDLRKPPPKTEQSHERGKETGQHHVTVVAEQRVVGDVDVRGLRVPEALVEVEKALDAAVLSGTSKVVVVHGHGTSRLKKEVRDYLERCPYCVSFEPGQPEEGGDAVTIVRL